MLADFVRQERNAAALHTGREETQAFTIAVHHRLDAVADVWRRFEQEAVATPYQRYDWLEPWHRHVGAAAGIEPLIAELRQADGSLAALLPFGLKRRGFLRVATWLGDKHSNYFMPLFRPEATALFDRDALLGAFRQIGSAAGADAFVLLNQPQVWEEQRNPIHVLGGQDAPSPAFKTALPATYEEYFASRSSKGWKKVLRRKMRQLDEEGRVEMLPASSPAEARATLEACLQQRERRFGKLRIPDPFGDERVRALYRELAGRTGEDAVLALYALRCNGEILATYAGFPFKGRFSASFSSFDEGPLSRFSPGDQLFGALVADCCARGMRSIDLGIGDAPYKRHWCREREQLFDSFLAFTLPGTLVASAARAKQTAKRRLKQDPRLWALVERMRGLRAGGRGETEAGD
jgi:CelD/BcsL family acetyltransferase involved in cellulose biosynthesis